MGTVCSFLLPHYQRAEWGKTYMCTYVDLQIYTFRTVYNFIYVSTYMSYVYVCLCIFNPVFPVLTQHLTLLCLLSGCFNDQLCISVSERESLLLLLNNLFPAPCSSLAYLFVHMNLVSFYQISKNYSWHFIGNALIMQIILGRIYIFIM